MSRQLQLKPAMCVVCGGEFQRMRSDKLTCRVGCWRAYRQSPAYRPKHSPEGVQRLRDRMLAANPMQDAATRDRMSATLQALGHAPKVRGGNGRGPTRAEAALAAALGPPWIQQYVVATGIDRSNNPHKLPTCYKLDLADPSTMTCIEVDGPSHNSLDRKRQDCKKEEFLRGRGWTVLRVTNREVLEALPSTISKLRGLTPTSRMAS